MSRPLLITDCDEVLLHMVSHFADWLSEAHGIDFAMDKVNFHGALSRRDNKRVLGGEEVWPLLDGFFATEMARQTAVPHALEALERLSAKADIVILTNLGDHCHAGRVAQLEAVGIRHRVQCNQGPKGAAVKRLVEEHRPSVAVFVDDLVPHHGSVAAQAPEVWRVHLIAEPKIAVHVPAAPDAHARIDDWREASRWIEARFADGRPAA